MDQVGLLLSYFIEPKDAQASLRTLGRRGFRRRVLLLATPDGRLLQRDPNRPLRLILTLAIAALLGASAGLLAAIGGLPLGFLPPVWEGLLLGLLGAVVGAALGWLISSRIFPSVAKAAIDAQSAWLRGEETLLILQAPMQALSDAVKVLRDTVESDVSIFALHAPRAFPEAPELRELSALPLPQIRAHAIRLAQEHRVDFKGGSSRALLGELDEARKTIHAICADLTESLRLEQSLSPVAEWILDNEYMIEGHGRDVQLNLPHAFYRELPALTLDPDRGFPRVYSLAKELVAHCDAHLDRENILAFLSAYQEGAYLTIGELWALPLMLRIALIQRIDQLARQAWEEMRDRELADFWANRLLATLRKDPDQLFSMLAALSSQQGSPSPYFATQLSGHLYDEDAALVPVQSWLERTLRKPLTELHAGEQARQAVGQISIGNAVSSLRQLSLIDWREIFEEQSHVERILRRDPAGVYADMDFETRNLYREAVEVLAKGSAVEEVHVARRVVEMAAAAQPAEGWESRQRHIGTYLIGDGRRALASAVGCRERWRHRFLQWVYRHHTALYLTSIAATTAGLMAFPLLRALAAGIGIYDPVALVLLGLPASQLAVQWTNYLATRILPPRRLPKLDFSREGIPSAYRTLIVVPMLLTDAATIRSEVEKLEIRFLANHEQNLLFGLFSDFMDASTETTERDAPLLKAAEEGIRRLNRRHGEGRFYLFHRPRTWSETEQKFIGWERKRGKLEELNRQILGLRGDDEPPIVRVGDPDRLTDIRFVITLDSDTQLPRDTARRMIETLAHPLNQPRYDEAGQVAQGSYALIQPRVSPSLPSAVATLFSRIFTDPVGTDPYTKAVSDVYQDLSGEGSYIGKGLYDVRGFYRTLAGRFRDESLLSHDLIEGAYVHTGLATDIELFDEFPRDYLAYSMRQHRWIRGDWQIAAWILPRVPDRKGGRVRNTLSLLNRWKIFDNLRRSLVNPASVAALALTWFLSPHLRLFSGALAAGMLLFQPLSVPLTWLTTRRGWRAVSPRQLLRDLSRAFAEAVLLMHQAGLALDAVLRTLYRKHISRRGLLEWTTAQVAEWQGGDQQGLFLLNFWLISALSLALAFGIRLAMPSSLPFALPWLALWFISPAFGWLFTKKGSLRRKLRALHQRDLRLLRRIARRTWRYFDDFVGPDTAWLPPDNYQYSHKNKLAMRTSPTNIGMWMLSALGATDFGYLTLEDAIGRLQNTMQTLDSLERHEGHLLNWYSLEDLAPLKPRYVSSVDSGNFLAALWTLDRGLAEALDRPVLTRSALAGLQDTLEVLIEEMEKEKLASEIRREAHQILDLVRSCPAEAGEIIRLVRKMHREVDAFAGSMREQAGLHAGAAYWARQLERQVTAVLAVIDRCLPWMEVLAERSERDLAEAGMQDLLIMHLRLHTPPSLRSLASGRFLGAHRPDFDRVKDQAAAHGLVDWFSRLQEALESSQAAAAEILSRAKKLQEAVRELAGEINLRFLYDPQRRLFSIGFNVSTNQLDDSYYDLLASESRLGSYVAIARGDVPVEHWLSLNRPYSSHGRHGVLLSWSGTMFEYLMPSIFQRTFPNSLLDQATREAVALQEAYGRRRRVPWGISESAYGDLDMDKTYQYKAFGVPWLGLKRGLDEDLVVAPYATLLAIGIDPDAAAKNLRRLSALGLLNDYGFYEAIDFNRRPKAEAAPGVIVRAYMAHHQGMGFLALTNYLQNNAMQRRFHSDPRVKSAEPLLYERIPISPPIHHISTRAGISSRIGAPGIAPSVSKFHTPHTVTPKVQLLSNGTLSTLATNAGGGYTRWKDRDITRWRADTTRDAFGSFLYLKDTDTGDTWSNVYHPLDREPDRYSVHFPLDRAEYRRRDNGLETQTELIVSPEDDVEVRRITLTNRSLRSRRIHVTSYYELALAPHPADRQHPAFNKLFIQTEAVQDSAALLAYRRQRQEDDEPVFAFHSLDLVGGSNGSAPLQYETDRRVFIGRGRTMRNPAAIDRKLANTAGYVLDPIFSLRREVFLLPGQSAQLIAVLGVAGSRRDVLRLADKYHDPSVVERAFEIAWASAQLELRSLRIQPDDARRFQKLAGYMIFPSSYLRPPADRIEANSKSQDGLWPYGISGDLPIALITIADAGDLGLVRQMLQAQAYWRQHGLPVDLVVLNEESSSYEQPLMERLERLVQSYSIYTGPDQPGGVFLRAVDQIPEEDLVLLQAVARVSLVAARGPLAQQIGVPQEVVEAPPPLISKRVEDEPSRNLPFMELPYFNSLGGFSADGREYVIYLGPEASTPAPWVNVIANPQFGTLVSETGAGFTWYGNSQRNRLTEWSNDPVMDPHAETIYIRDEESGHVWNPTAGPIREREAYRVSHGAGYTRFEHNSHAIEQLLTVFVPVDEDGGAPVKIGRLTLRNDSKRTRTLSVTYYIEWTLGEGRETAQQHVVTQWEGDLGAVLARNGYHPDYGERVAFAAISPPAETFTCDRTLFIGRNGSLTNPAAMKRARLSERVGAELDPAAALQAKLELAPGDSVDVICLLGQAASEAEALALIKKYREVVAANEALDETTRYWDKKLGALQVETPELSVDVLLNRWLLYQSLSCRIWGRSAFYQSGGAFGFRDQLQDVAAFLFSDPGLARDQILLAASHQFAEGDVQHWWHPPSNAGIRSRISDDMLWLPFIAAQYIRTTGDAAILNERIPFLIAPQLEPDQSELFLEPEVSLEKESLFEHCRLAVEKGLTKGPHGLPLIGTGDWNDGLNRVGEKGSGESVWLGWFLIEVLRDMADLAEMVDQPDLAEHYRHEAQMLESRIEAAAWDGAWYLRGTFDDGTPLGSASSREARIDSLPQSWPWIVGAGEPQRKEQALESAWRQLVRPDDKLVLLFTPPFDVSEPSPGYIRGYPPGVRENGGQYTHAALWLAMAFARKGDGDRAGEILRILNPVEHAREVPDVWRYMLEPYVIAADIYRVEGHLGQGGWSWYTGSAAWMYRVWTEEMLGLRKRGERLFIDPVIPQAWDGFRAELRHGEALYAIEVQNPDRISRGVLWIELDGRHLKEGYVPLEDEPVKHIVRVRMGKGEGER